MLDARRVAAALAVIKANAYENIRSPASAESASMPPFQENLRQHHAGVKAIGPISWRIPGCYVRPAADRLKTSEFRQPRPRRTMAQDQQPTDVRIARPFKAETVRLAPGLYVVATPIGNLGDVTLRALSVLASADLVLCEDTRITRRLLDRYGLRPQLLSYHEHNAAAVRPRVLARLGAGESVALVSDAGTPLVSDPGYKLVEAAIEKGHAVFPIPGPSAALAALVAAGLPTDRFLFEGFLPAKAGQRRTRIGELASIPATLIFYESGPRLAASLTDLAATFGDRPAAVCRELTKAFEEVRRGKLPLLAEHYVQAGAPKGEIVIVVGPPNLDMPFLSSEALDAKLHAALARLSVKDAASTIAAETGIARRDVYQRAVALVGSRERKK
jgi:16S rRNA (cytidine1402-2'-O)-methyltransferase